MQIRQMLDKGFESTITVRPVMDNLNTHTIASPYETFNPTETRCVSKLLDTHYTPKHGSWLNMVEISLSALKGQFLDRLIPDRAIMQAEGIGGGRV